MKANNTIVIPSNFNNKLACGIMQHVDIAPWQPIPESAMKKAIIEFKTADGSFPPTYWRLIDLVRLGLDEMVSVFTYPSHGMDSFEFYQWLIKQYAEKKDYTKLAVYVYERLPAVS